MLTSVRCQYDYSQPSSTVIKMLQIHKYSYIRLYYLQFLWKYWLSILL